MTRQIPNAFTILNMISGMAATVLLFEGHTSWVLICALVCLIADTLDGMLARALNAQSELGAQLDSFADVVAFGVLPGAILYVFWGLTCSGSTQWPALIACVIPAVSAIRLAKFNLDTRDRTVFYGLPVPSAAIAIFGILWMYSSGHPWLSQMSCNPIVFVSLIVLLSLLMLSNLRLWSLKGISEKNGKLILAVAGVLIIGGLVVLKAAALPVLIALYICFGLLNILIKVY